MAYASYIVLGTKGQARTIVKSMFLSCNGFIISCLGASFSCAIKTGVLRAELSGYGSCKRAILGEIWTSFAALPSQLLVCWPCSRYGMMGKGVTPSESRLAGQGFRGRSRRSRSLPWTSKMNSLDERQNNAEELHNVINVVFQVCWYRARFNVIPPGSVTGSFLFQNIHDLSPSLRELVMSAKQYYKAMQSK